MVNDIIIKSITFEKTILKLINNVEYNEKVGKNYYSIKDGDKKVFFDFYSQEGIDLGIFENELFIPGCVAVDIKYKLENHFYKFFIERALKCEIKTVVIFTLSKLKEDQKQKIYESADPEIKLYIFDRNKLEKITEIKKILNNLNEYIFENAGKNNYFEELKNLSKNKISFALGAGCSLEANISDWTTLSKALGYEMIYNILDPAEAAFLNMSISNTMSEGLFSNFDKTSALDAIHSFYETQSLTNKYLLYLKKVLYMSYDSPKDANTPLMDAICNCIKKYSIKELISYNFDSILEQALDKNYESEKKEVLNSTTSVLNSMIYHVHGYIPFDYDGKTPVSNLVFTDKEYYENAVNKNNFTNSMQKYLFDNYDVIFVGISFTDSNLKEILRERMANRNTNTQLYAFFKLPSFESKGREKIIIEEKYKILQQSYFDTLGVKIIWVRNYQDIPMMLGDI